MKGLISCISTWLTTSFPTDSKNLNFLPACTGASFAKSTCVTLHLVLIFTTNSVPLPTSLKTCTVPPILSISCLQIDNPSPVPDLFLPTLSSSLPKSTNNFGKSSLLMPTPVSLIVSSRSMAYSSPILGIIVHDCYTPEILLSYLKFWSICCTLILFWIWLWISFFRAFRASSSCNYWSLLILRPTVTLPESVNFRELLTKFSKIAKTSVSLQEYSGSCTGWLCVRFRLLDGCGYGWRLLIGTRKHCGLFWEGWNMLRRTWSGLFPS